MLKRTLLFTSPVYLSMKNEQLVVALKIHRMKSIPFQ